MTGTAEAFLKYNTDSAMMHILAIEDHLRHLDRSYASEDASCLVKHALQLREQSLEGISHSNEVRDPEKVEVFRDLERGAERLRERFGQRVNPDTLILEVRQLRKRAEILDPSFNLDKCKSCGRAEGVLGELKRAFGSPDGGILEKGLNPKSEKFSVKSDNNMTIGKTTKDVALAVGGVNVGWGIGYAAKQYIDPMAPGAIMGQNPSLFIDVLGTLGLAVGAIKMKGDQTKKLLALLAAGLSTHLWEDLSALLASPATSIGAKQQAINNAYNQMAAQGYPVVGTQAVGEGIPYIPAMPYPATRLAEYPFAAPVSIGPTMSPPHYTINGVSGLKTVVLGPKYTLDT